MIHLERKNEVMVVTLENGKVNVLDTTFLQEIEQCFKDLSRDECKSVVITGAGNSFCAGVDLKKTFTNGDQALSEFMDALSSCFKTLFEFNKPLIGAINGHALAGGCIISSACDYKVLAEGRAKIGITELAVGLSFPMTPLEIMRFVIPQNKLQEVFYFAKGYNAEDAKKLGLIDEVINPELLQETALKYALKLASIPAETFSKTKQQLRAPFINAYSSNESIEFDKDIKKQWSSNETKEVVSAFIESLKKS
jgi:enoyl-CoA hydratase